MRNNIQNYLGVCDLFCCVYQRYVLNIIIRSNIEIIIRSNAERERRHGRRRRRRSHTNSMLRGACTPSTIIRLPVAPFQNGGLSNSRRDTQWRSFIRARLCNIFSEKKIRVTFLSTRLVFEEESDRSAITFITCHTKSHTRTRAHKCTHAYVHGMFIIVRRHEYRGSE